jgi:hypothetical protein
MDNPNPLFALSNHSLSLVLQSVLAVHVDRRVRLLREITKLLPPHVANGAAELRVIICQATENVMAVNAEVDVHASVEKRKRLNNFWRPGGAGAKTVLR